MRNGACVVSDFAEIRLAEIHCRAYGKWSWIWVQIALSIGKAHPTYKIIIQDMGAIGYALTSRCIALPM